jgi:DNA-binding XRE family transcriptional regulator
VRGASVGTTCGYQMSVRRARARSVADAVVSHSSVVMGTRLARCVLRPRAGRNAWRCIYERIGDVVVIGAVGLEAQKDKAGFDASSAAKAARRDRSVTRAIAITTLVYSFRMKLSDLPTHENVLAEHLAADAEYRREWERSALARAVAVKVIAYRAEHELSQTALAKRLKMSQPAVARLESGEHSPTFPMLLRISDALRIELAIDIAPSGQEPQLIGSRARRYALDSFQGSSYAVVIAAT